VGFERGGRQRPSAEGDRRDEERAEAHERCSLDAHCRLTPNASTRLCLSRSRPAAGSVACQILDAMYPGEVPMSRGASEGGKRRVGKSVVRSPKGPPPYHHQRHCPATHPSRSALGRPQPPRVH
jgi:hypothetical protein